ncbi:hypothetical protein CVT25_004296 [Psilocybe cyanescens]|uniref:Uncharacterized protein n=1 Tax=Psilocybe cyanescens TaxID=93625 RepID=A0A409XDX7_PSICY|nr:hypothetical protein CVT25_004296 [Psilocybe cyanescens]
MTPAVRVNVSTVDVPISCPNFQCVRGHSASCRSEARLISVDDYENPIVIDDAMREGNGWWCLMLWTSTRGRLRPRMRLPLEGEDEGRWTDCFFVFLVLVDGGGEASGFHADV